MKIYNFGNFKVNNFVLQYCNGLIIVDSGYPGDFNNFETKFYKANLNPNDIKFLVLTHAHNDHVGFLDDLLKMTEVKIILHPEAVKTLLEGRNPKTHKASNKLIQLITKYLMSKEKLFPPINMPDRYLIFDNNQQYLQDAGFDIRIKNLKGHTEDSIALELPNKSIICGDAIMNMPISRKYQPLVLENLEDLKESWDYMIANFDNIIPLHGKAITSNQLKKKRKYLDCVKLYDL